MKQFNVTELDFDNIKSAIKAYYKRSDGPFKDFDFEGSGLNLILDVLAYNTHYNAILAHLAANESFISSAQLRKNVVARAKTLGYIPRSKTASTATITLTNFDASTVVSIPEGTSFSATDNLNGVTYSFVNIAEVSNPALAFPVHQGSLKTRQYIFDSKDENLKFEIPDVNVDISKLTVTSFLNSNSTQAETYTKFTELGNIDGDSLIYFINENPNGKYEIQFGDNILGKQPSANSVIQIKYLVTDGAEANGLSTFTTSESLFSAATPTVTSAGATSNGGDKEGIESIRANAPLNYLSQNRAVTVDDYIGLVRNNASVSAVSVWGGENQNPPEYGKVFISVKPQNALVLTSLEKATLLPILRSKGIITVRPEFVDPDYTFLYFDLFTKYNSTLTSLGASGITSLVIGGISSFNSAHLADFDGVFRYSQFLAFITNLDTAILSTFARVKAYKKFTATVSSTSSYKINFNFALEKPQDPTSSLISSTAMVIGGIQEFFADEASTEANTRNIYRYKEDAITGLNIMTERNVGTINCETGLVTIEDFNIDTDTEISLFVKPASNDIAPSRNQIIELDSVVHTVVESEIDSIATSGTAGAIDYNTTAREDYS